jgi:hypothetical protein
MICHGQSAHARYSDRSLGRSRAVNGRGAGIGMARMSEARVLCPKLAPRSHRSTSVLPDRSSLSATLIMSQGAGGF